MDITPQSAEESLADIRSTMSHTRAALASYGGSDILMLWGMVWVVGYGVQQFWPQQAGWFWLGGNTVGVIGTIAIANGLGRPRPVRSSTLNRLGWRVFVFWCALSVYSWLWFLLLPPLSDLQTAAFMTTIVMLAYVVMGLWFDSWFIVGLGLVITALVAAGYWLWPEYFCLWMGLAGGGALFGSGLYMRLRWR